LKDNLLLVNKSNTLGSDYTPPGLIYSKPARGRSTVNLRLDGEAMLNLNLMLEAAYNEGIKGMVITSAFRTFDKQTSLFNNKTTTLSRKMNRKDAMEAASKVVAIPGSSEHQTGLAADICSEGVGLVSNFGNTVQGKWIAENSWRHGFIVRYPKEKTEITGIIYEPWHVRYVGNGHAELMKSRNLCFEEYVEYLNSKSVIHFTDSTGADYVIQYISQEDFKSTGLALSLPDDSTWTISSCTKDSYVLTIKL
jgi:LAS superfamily LD-carboxypeptidase LdcB